MTQIVDLFLKLCIIGTNYNVILVMKNFDFNLNVLIFLIKLSAL